MPGMPSLWMSCCCCGVISRFSQTKPFFDAEPLAHLGGVEIGQRRGQQFDRLVLVDDPARLGEQRRRLDVGGEHCAVAVDDVGPRGGDGVLRAGAPRAVAVADHRERSPAGRRSRRRSRRRRRWRSRRGRAPSRRGRRCGRTAGCGSAAAARAPRARLLGIGLLGHWRGLRRRQRAGDDVGIDGRRSSRRSDRARRDWRSSAAAPAGSSTSRIAARSIGFSFRCRSASPCSRIGASSLAHSARSAAIASRCSRISACSRSTRSVRDGRVHLDLVDIGGGEHQRADDEEMDEPHRQRLPHHAGQRRPVAATDASRRCAGASVRSAARSLAERARGLAAISSSSA